MGHYASEVGYYDGRPSTPDDQNGYLPENKKLIEDFYAPEYPGTGSSCPRCGASLDWNWTRVRGVITHIKWHENLEAILQHQPRPYPGRRL
ncbi:hypothetical protein SEA_CECE_118 [Microbacterium phage Cece]|nr:hypothetical protein SEA_CECE_118 [Microbacterium phage Cece]